MKSRKKLTTSVEDYVATIFRMDMGQGVRLVDIARKLKVSKPSVHRAVRLLVEKGLVEQEPYQNIFITEAGKQASLKLTYKFGIIRSFLVSVLGVDEKIAHSEAHHLEHVLSDDTVERLGKLVRAHVSNN